MNTIQKSSKISAPFFSVIIPTLNEEIYLPRLLTALKKQTFHSFEVIVIDGFSEDKTIENARPYSASLPKLVLRRSKKRGVAHQRNIGAKLAKGKFFIFFDADVAPAPTFLQKISAKLHKENIQFITTWIEPDTHKNSERMISAAYNVLMELEKFIGKPYIHGFNTIIGRDLFIKVGQYDETLTMSEDQELALRVCKGGVDLRILRSPRLTFSLRRFRSEGLLAVVRKQAHANIYTIIQGKITKKIMDYPMGGHVHIEPKKGGVRQYVDRTQKKLMRTVVQRAKKLSKSSLYI